MTIGKQSNRSGRLSICIIFWVLHATFDASPFVDIRKKLTPDLLQSINERLLGIGIDVLLPDHDTLQTGQQQDDEPDERDDPPSADEVTHKGELLMDANVAPQTISYPTDLNLLNDSRMKSGQIIDFLWYGYKQKVRESQESHLF